MKTNLFAICLVLLGVSLHAKVNFNNDCKKAYLQIINLDFEAAKNQIKEEKKNNPNNAVANYLESFRICFELFNSESNTEYLRLKDFKKETITQLEKEPASNPYRNFLIAETYIHWAVVSFKNANFVKAAKELNTAYSFIEWNNRLHPEFAPNKKLLALLNLAIGTIPDEYSWLVSLLGYEGSYEKGINSLNAFYTICLEDSSWHYQLAEAYLLKMMAAIHFSKSENGVQRTINDLNNPKFANLHSYDLIKFASASGYMFLGRNDLALKALPTTSKLSYLDYLKGLCLLYKLDSGAEKHFNAYLLKGTSHFVKSAYQKIAWCELINNNQEGYKNIIALAGKNGSKLFEADKAAMREFEQNNIPNLILLKARLLFDGGYYERALHILQNTNAQTSFSETVENLEYIYRFGRVYHKLAYIPKAIEYYNLTIELGKDFDAYFAANAALNLGLIYESLKEYEKASAYYTLCISLKNFGYSSISQEAKSKIKGLKKKGSPNY